MSLKKTRHPVAVYSSGKGVSPGIVIGKIFVVREGLGQLPTWKGAAVELERFLSAQAAVLERMIRLKEKALAEIGEEEAAIFEAHEMMIQDEEWSSRVRFYIEEQKVVAEKAVQESLREQMEVFESSSSEILRGRVTDLKDLQSQFLAALGFSQNNLSEINSPVILVAGDLTPSQTVGLERKNILGMITQKGGQTSHTAILARASRIPAVVGVAAIDSLENGQEIALDGLEGNIYLVNSADSRSYFTDQVEHERQQRARFEQFRGKESTTLDGRTVDLYANIGGVNDLEAVHLGDAEGIGLFRTEFLFMERTTAPSLEEQRESYAKILNGLGSKEVVVRTLDVGGDKPIAYLNFPKEENPFLGLRAIRYCFQHLDVFKTQIKAMLLANENGNLSILLPMVSNAEEVKLAQKIIQDCHDELTASEHKYAHQPYKIGAMIEIPSLIYEMKELARYVSFVSVGTNDLLQYTVAVDRMNAAVQDLYTPYHLGFLRMMRVLAQEAIQAGLNLGICGELGGSPLFIPLWIAMGFNKLSMNPGQILEARALIHDISFESCQKLLDSVLNCSNQYEVERELKKGGVFDETQGGARNSVSHVVSGQSLDKNKFS